MIKLTRLGHVDLAARDLDALADHHRDVLGLVEVGRPDADTVHLAVGFEHHSVALRRGSEDAVRHVAFGVDPELSLSDAQTHLADHGVHAELQTDAELGTAQLLELRDPEGNVLQLYHEIEGEHAGPTGPADIRPQKLGHVCLRAADVPALAAWYETVLGFRWSDWIGDFFVFLRCNTYHHVFNLLRGDQPGALHHMAYELRDWGEIQPAVDALARNGNRMIWGPGRHGAGHNIFTYHHDPAGNMVELFTQLDVIDEDLGCFEPRPWHLDHPQRPKRWPPTDLIGANQWGVPPPEGFL